jgi:hypothetical protein
MVLVLGLAGSAQAATYNWTNIGDGNSWCNRFNWDPNTAVPGPQDDARIRLDGGADRGPVIDCPVHVGLISGPYRDQDVDITTNLTVNIATHWEWDDVDNGWSHVNITGSPDLTIGGKWWIADSDNAKCELNISGNPTITVGTEMITTTADNDDPRKFWLNMSNGSLDVAGRFAWDEGGGEMNVSGGATVECGELFYSGELGVPWTLNLDGEGTIYVIGAFTVLDEPEGDANAFMNLDSGTLECGSFNHGDYKYAMDINEGEFIIDGNEVAAMNADVNAGYITAFSGAAAVIVTYDDVSDKTTVKADYVQVKASDPSPDNYALNVCPGVELSWQAGEYCVDDHNVYFGTSMSDVNESASPFLEHHDTNSFAPTLEIGTTYYWRVDEVNDACDASPWVVDPSWQFTTNDGNAFDPHPENTEPLIPIDANLHWTPGCTADSHDVYLGTDYSDVRDANNSWPVGTSVYKGNQVVGANEYDPCDFDYFTYYYWRIDEVDNGTIHKGEVWSFRTIADINDPNLILWYKFDETTGSIASDSSGYEHHGSGYRIEGQWEPNNGHIDGCLDFDAEEHVKVPTDTLETINKEITVSVWIKGDDSHADEEGRVFDTGAEGYRVRARIPTEEKYLLWRAGNDTNDSLLWHQADPSAWAEDWHFFAFVKDENAGTMKIYFDGFEAKSKSGTINSLINVKGTAFRIGANNDQSDDYTGKVDDFRVYNRALSPTKIAGLFRGGDVGIAWAPSPFDGEIDVLYDVNLSWMPGDYVNDVNGHDVYIGSDFDDVNDANSSVHPNVDYNNVSDTNYDPGPLEGGQTYYWRVDEVNDPCTWKGKVWRFTVADFIIIDDMEDYTDCAGNDYPITTTQHDDYGWVCSYQWEENETGSLVDLVCPGSSYNILAHRGDQAMYYFYDSVSCVYSEIWNHFELEPNDWTIKGVKMLTLWFYGDPENANTGIEPMYVGLDSGSGSYSQVTYGDGEGEDGNDIAIAEWQEWNIALNEFTTVNLEDVNKLYIGFGDREGSQIPGRSGNVYFDDIRLYPPICVPSKRPSAFAELDLDNDCAIGWGDVEIMTEQWLKADVNLGVVEEPDPCVLHYKFDETEGNTVTDYSTYDYHGTARVEDGNVTDAFWEPNGMYGRCIRFEHRQKKYCVAVPNDVFDNHITNRITISVWVNWDDPATMPEEKNQLFSMHGGPDANYNPILGIETEWLDDEEIAFWDADNSITYEVDDGDWWGGWNHYVFVKDVNVVPGVLKIYHNGQLAKQGDSNEPMIFPADNAWIGIATDSPNDVHDYYAGEWHDEYTGLLDDFRIYDYNLSEPEIGYLASGGTGIYSLD